MIGNLTKKRMKEVLASVTHGHLACHADGETYCVPIFYAYDGDHLYGHTYGGKKIAMMKKNPRVCVLVHTLKSLWNWESVMVQGDFEQCHGKDAVHAIELLSERLHASARKSAYYLGVVKNQDSHYFRRDHRPVIFYRIRIRSMTGRYERQGLTKL
ncbi:MAG TPA: pyridoxamine 5'-phosphate oxidase family protein [Candidatus Peribacterales bacterium]|nr:pyridoxamine 5'-phosphate oxidase family protein [Candidatus Peribacterales bacterium]